MLLSDFIRRSSNALASVYPEGEASSIVALWLHSHLGVERYAHILNPALEVPADMLSLLEEDLARLLDCEPVQYVLGEAEFCSHRFRVGPGVLVPRPETEDLVALACKALPRGGRVLDLCTGSGCIAWSIASQRRDASVLGVDISREALCYARTQNIFSSQECAAQPRWLECDILAPDAVQSIDIGLEGRGCDLLTCNPPYIRSCERAQMRRNVLDYEPGLALFAPDSDPLVFYRATARIAAALLNRGGRGIVEINEQLGKETAAIFAAEGLGTVTIIDDFVGKNRFVSFEKPLL